MESRARTVDPASPRDLALLAVATLAISLASPLAKDCSDVSALVVAAGRCAVGSVLLFAFAPRETLRALAGLSARQGAALVGVGALLAGHFACFLWGLATTSLPAAVALVSLEPLFVVLVAWASFGLRPRTNEIAGVVVAVVGALVIGRAAGSGENKLFGDLLVLGAVVLYGLYVAAARGLQHMMPVVPYAASVYGVAAIMLAPFALVAARHDPGGRTIVNIILLGILPTLVGHTLVQRLARRLSPSLIALAPAGETMFALAIAAAWQKVIPTPAEGVGAAVILAGALLVSRPTPKT